MVREIVKDVEFLNVPCERFENGKHDYLVQDLLDTANAHIDKCVGLACNQIGESIRVIAVRNGDKFMIMKNPMIIKKSGGTFTANERCLSLDGERSVTRHRQVVVMYEDINGKQRRLQCNGFTAQIIQHECDHLKGILI